MSMNTRGGPSIRSDVKTGSRSSSSVTRTTSARTSRRMPVSVAYVGAAGAVLTLLATEAGNAADVWDAADVGAWGETPTRAGVSAGLVGCAASSFSTCGATCLSSELVGKFVVSACNIFNARVRSAASPEWEKASPASIAPYHRASSLYGLVGNSRQRSSIRTGQRPHSREQVRWCRRCAGTAEFCPQCRLTRAGLLIQVRRLARLRRRRCRKQGSEERDGDRKSTEAAHRLPRSTRGRPAPHAAFRRHRATPVLRPPSCPPGERRG